MREKYFVEYPICLNYQMALAWLEAGHEIWQEDSGDPDVEQCCGFDDLACFCENFTDGEVRVSDNLHLVPSTPEKVKFPEVGDEIYAIEDIWGAGMQDDESPVPKNSLTSIDHVEQKDTETPRRRKGRFTLWGVGNQYGDYSMEQFVYAKYIMCCRNDYPEELVNDTYHHLMKYKVNVPELVWIFQEQVVLEDGKSDGKNDVLLYSTVEKVLAKVEERAKYWCERLGITEEDIDHGLDSWHLEGGPKAKEDWEVTIFINHSRVDDGRVW